MSTVLSPEERVLKVLCSLYGYDGNEIYHTNKDKILNHVLQQEGIEVK